jgi:drug/metabolite transporter (DMT)-like permease
MSEYPDRRKGLTLAVMAAMSLAFITTFAKLTYQNGSTPLTLITFRALTGVIVLLILARLFEGPLKIERKAIPSLLMSGLGLGMITFGYMSSVAYIPVGLAALIFYLFPLILLVYEAIHDRRRPGIRRITAFAMAFVGLALALGPSMENLDIRGVAFAFFGGLGSVVFFIGGQKASNSLGPLGIGAISNVMILPIAAAVMFAFDAYALPDTDIGWSALLLACLAYLLGVSFQLGAVRFAKPSEAGLIHNIEPVVSIAIAWFVLNEVLSPIQLVGVALVILSISYGSRLASHS